MASRQREISVSEFFLKNCHLLGFDTPAKALVTAVKEAVDNALDACEEAGILPEISVQVRDRDGKSRVVVEDNGPGIVESQIARIFGKLLYGSKFHKLSQSRGQQGMGISAAGMYGQLTVGKPLHIISRVAGDELASELYVSIDTANNRPDIHKKKRVKWGSPHGTRVEMEMEGHYQKGPHSIEVYLKQTAIANPHVTITYEDPQKEQIHFIRSTDQLPVRPKEIKTHPHGIELGRLIQMLSNTQSPTLLRFLADEFSCVGKKTALKILSWQSKDGCRHWQVVVVGMSDLPQLAVEGRHRSLISGNVIKRLRKGEESYATRSMHHEHRDARLAKHVISHAAQQTFPPTPMAEGAHDQECSQTMGLRQ